MAAHAREYLLPRSSALSTVGMEGLSPGAYAPGGVDCGYPTHI